MINLFKNIILSKFGFHKPISGIFWITNSCNSRCIMCGIWAAKKKEDINVEKFRELVSKSKVLQNLNSITFTGGEIFLRKDLDKFIEYTLKYCNPTQIRLSTNGFLTEKILKFTEYILKKHKKTKFSVKISLDGFGKTHDKTRGVPGAFDKAIKTLKGLNKIKQNYKSRLHLGISFTVNSKNMKEIYDVRKLALQNKWEFFYKPCMMASLYGNVEDLDKELFVKPGQTKELIKFNRLMFNDLKKQNILTRLINKNYYKILINYLKNPRRLIKCYAGSASFHVTSKGEVYPCQSVSKLMGNINEHDFDKIWFGKKAKQVRKFIKNANCHCVAACDTSPSIIVDKFPFY